MTSQYNRTDEIASHGSTSEPKTTPALSQLFRSAVVGLLALTAFGAVGTTVLMYNEASRHKEAACVNVIYDYDGKLKTKFNEADRRYATAYDCDLNAFLRKG